MNVILFDTNTLKFNQAVETKVIITLIETSRYIAFMPALDTHKAKTSFV